MKIYPSRYKDQPAVTLESEVVRAQFLPHIGSKMCSLIYKPRNVELMVQTPGDQYRMQPYDGVYEAGECSGFDEMFPTIDTCFFEHYPWQGSKIPDHGEVWSLPWEHRVEDQTLYFGVHGVRFPYKLEKWVSMTDDSIIRIDYLLTNLSDFDFAFLWSAHTMINLEEGVELVLPPEARRIVSIFQLNGIGEYGEEQDWPIFSDGQGKQIDRARLQPQSTRRAEKYYIKGKLSSGWCALKYHRSQFGLALSFPAATVPYLAVLSNEGGWRDIYNIFLEPATATFDRPDVARLHQQASILKARSTYRWHLNVSLFDQVDFQSVNEAGKAERDG